MNTGKSTPSTESELLSQEAAKAQAAIKKVVGELKIHLAQGTDPRLWARQYPLVAIGAGLVAGFSAAVAAVPSKRDQALKNLQAIKQAIQGHDKTPEPTNGHSQTEPKTAAASNGAASHSLLGSVVKEAFTFLRPIVISAITAKMTPPAVPPTDPNTAADPSVSARNV